MAHMSVLVVDLTFGECMMHHRDRVHRGKLENDYGDSFSVLQARKNLKFFPDKWHVDSYPFDSAHVSSLSQRSQSYAEIEADLSLFSAVLAISARGNLLWFRPEAGLWPLSSVVKTSCVCRRHTLIFMQRWGLSNDRMQHNVPKHHLAVVTL